MLKSGFHAKNPPLVRRSAPIGLAQQRITLVTWMNKSLRGLATGEKGSTFGSLGAGQRFLALHRRNVAVCLPSHSRHASISASSHSSKKSLSEGILKIDVANVHTSTSLPTGSCNQCHSVMTTNTRTSKPLRQNPEGPVAKVRYLLLLNIYSGS
jgi:hypothetical protein